MPFGPLVHSAMDTAGGEPGVWVPLRVLRQLPLPFAAYHQLITSLRGRGRAAPEDPLLAELAEASATALREALERSDPEEALAAHDLLLGDVAALVAVRPELAAVLWPRYGDLLGQLTIQVHGRVMPQQGERADAEAAWRRGDAALCLRMARALEQGLAQPWEVPDWLPVLEQQLVQHGALAGQHGSGNDPAAAGICLDLFLRLAQLVDPVPDWVAQACRRAMGQVIEALPPAGAMGEDDLALLVERVGRLPVAAEQRPAFDAALLRARFSLELMQQGRGAGGRAAAAGLEVLEPEWLDDGDGPGGSVPPPPLRLVATVGDAVVADPENGLEIFSLAPYLDGDGDGAMAALEVFLEPWQGGERRSVHPIASLVESLAGQGPLPGPPLMGAALAVLRRGAALWQERLAAQIDPLPAVDWGAAGLVVELDPLELAVLGHARGAADPLEEALAELRRRHHDTDFWEAPAGGPVTPELGALEALRRFELEAGFYSTTHAPLESLRQWAQPALQGLLPAQVWSAEPATQGLWLPWGLEGIGRLRQPPSGRGLLERLGGEEVVAVAAGTAALQEAHRAGRLFAGEAFGLRCLETPESRHPQRPAAGFASSLETLVAVVEALYRERPFTVLLAGGGAYRLPLAQAIASRFGVLAVVVATPLAEWLR